MNMLYTEDEITLISIIPEEDLTGTTTKAELEKVIYDCLSIGPMFDPLIKDLESKGLIDDGEIQCKDLVKALYSNSFL
jgi:hypothetical protein